MIKLKKSIILTVATYSILLSIISTSAEEKVGKVDLFLMTGYGLPLGGYYLKEEIDQSQKYDANNQLIEIKDHYLNYGYGLKIEGGGDYFLMKNLGVQLCFSYILGLPSIKVTYDKPNAISESKKYTQTYKRGMLGVKLMLIPRVHATEKIDMYTGLGIGMFFTSLKIDNDDKQYFRHEGSIETKPGLALSGLLGADYSLNNKISAFLELSFDQISFKIKKRTYTQNGSQHDYEKDQIGSFAPESIPGSNIGLRIGIRFIVLNMEPLAPVF